MAVITYREALGQALAEEMERDPDVFLMGEEVGVYNGASPSWASRGWAWARP
jgi:pyruvate dehydrogenase E1 component beta subunit